MSLLICEELKLCPRWTRGFFNPGGKYVVSECEQCALLVVITLRVFVHKARHSPANVSCWLARLEFSHRTAEWWTVSALNKTPFQILSVSVIMDWCHKRHTVSYFEAEKQFYHINKLGKIFRSICVFYVSTLRLYVSIDYWRTWV